jgi:hypothetical protein
MKKIILISCLAIFSFGMENSENISTKKTSTWIDPSKKICINSGGRYDKNLCFANLKDAQNICSSTGGKVPSYEDFSKEASLCGGDFKKGNIKTRDFLFNTLDETNAKFYHSCYRKKGFKGKSYDDGTGGLSYMTSNQTEDKTVIIDFFNLTEFAVSLNAHSIIRCIK